MSEPGSGPCRGRWGVLSPAGRRLILGIILTGYLGLAAGAAWQLSPTQDEPLHLAAGYTYWEKHDYRMQPENGLLAQRWIGLGPWLHGGIVPVPVDGRWEAGQQWMMSFRFLEDNGHRVLVAGRLMMVLAGAGLLLAVYGWSRRLWGDAGGLFSAAVAAFSPTLLAHASQATSDVFLALTFLVAAWRLMEFLRSPRWWKAGLAGLACGAAALSKYTAIILAPYAAVVLGLAWWCFKPARPGPFWWPRLGGLVVAAVVAYGTIWAGYGFRYSAFHPELPGRAFNQSWDDLRTEAAPSRAIAFMQERRWWPEPFLFGAELAYAFSRSRIAFFMGEVSGGGYRLYFPLAFLLKSAPLLLGALLILAVGLPRWWRNIPGDVPRWAYTAGAALAGAILFFLFCLQSNLNIGHRHMLPVYPFLFVLAGGVVPLLLRLRWGAVVLGVGVWGHALAATLAFPGYLAYFNSIAGGSANGYFYFADSSYDWGQEIYRLSEWERVERPTGEIQYAIFSPMHASYHGLRGRTIFQFGGNFPHGYAFPPLEAGLLAASATMVSGPYFFTSSMNWTEEDERNYQFTRGQVSRANEAGGQDPAAWRAFLVSQPAQPWEDIFQAYSRLRIKRFLAFAREEGELVARPAETIFIWRVSDPLVSAMGIDDEPEIGLDLNVLWPLLREVTAKAQDRNEATD